MSGAVRAELLAWAPAMAQRSPDVPWQRLVVVQAQRSPVRAIVGREPLAPCLPRCLSSFL